MGTADRELLESSDDKEVFVRNVEKSCAIINT